MNHRFGPLAAGDSGAPAGGPGRAPVERRELLAQPQCQPAVGHGGCEAESAAEQDQHAPGQPTQVLPGQQSRIVAIAARQEEQDNGRRHDDAGIRVGTRR